MYIGKIIAKNVFAGPGNMALVAEAVVENDAGEVVYVTIQDYEGTEYTVSKQSVYEFLAGSQEEPASEFLEEYLKFGVEAKASAYAEVFAKLKRVIKMLG